MYDVNSKCADDFINHEEILDTLAYADENKENIELIDSIIEKAKNRQGLSHREASVLLACPVEEKNRRSISWRSRSRKISTETASLCSRRFICLTTASTAVPTAPTMRRTNTLRESSSLRKISEEKLSHFKIWATSVLLWKPGKIP